jgi:hypothetical protein
MRELDKQSAIYCVAEVHSASGVTLRFNLCCYLGGGREYIFLQLPAEILLIYETELS